MRVYTDGLGNKRLHVGPYHLVYTSIWDAVKKFFKVAYA